VLEREEIGVVFVDLFGSCKKMSFSPSPPPVFIGESYNIWAVKMKTYLQAHNLWNVV